AAQRVVRSGRDERSDPFSFAPHFLLDRYRHLPHGILFTAHHFVGAGRSLPGPRLPQPYGIPAGKPAALEVEEKALREVDQDSVVESSRNDVPVIDAKHASRDEPRVRGEPVTAG